MGGEVGEVVRVGSCGRGGGDGDGDVSIVILR